MPTHKLRWVAGVAFGVMFLEEWDGERWQPVPMEGNGDWLPGFKLEQVTKREHYGKFKEGKP